MAFKFPKLPGSTPAGTTKKAGTTATKPAPKATTTKKVAVNTGTRSGGVGYRKYQGDALWLPNTARPEWLDGSLTTAPPSGVELQMVLRQP
ncbi:hypothetical protein HXX76_005498 [Chlamydomonas incerta]|uniref:Uncharacterized protein n=1 Tax=Chlamydomonas incerta TaxID=51695 RepID=A0A835T5N9_CHLIN|nr:hypothetical protein HXX76_005498 [Chlamydomonas incerta]|eukprot:KAG2437881.1 hypothetical protein HXX76_005498 [Chlamydomonas incerta]